MASLLKRAMWIGFRAFMGRINSSILPPILLDGIAVCPEESLKVLGVMFDCTLSWRAHCTWTARKTFALLSRLRRCQCYLTYDVRLLLIKGLIFPYLDYCASLFLGLSNELSLKLGRCKNAAIRFVTRRKIFEHITPDYVDLEILQLKTRCDFIALYLLTNVLSTNIPDYLGASLNFVSTDRPGGSRRFPLDLHIGHFPPNICAILSESGLATSEIVCQP
ncbi:hypothetical protein TSAR_014699 [Trichomalopsis sarcophagae]|uniref:Reverse transcriptase domain-containing protein n=1 Tax=Trichomalopsis sarcophagae TaxID=543379 RepID=A0A232EHD9_9HYME|nr:hypothetical protein TSAR_014699 [Trichomalopsis sarcophagae]